jgi:hypothetical protein
VGGLHSLNIIFFTVLSTKMPPSHLHSLQNNIFFDNANFRGHLIKCWGTDDVNNL